MNRESKNPWTSEDEREHFPSAKEWWCGEAFFNSVEDNKKWSLKTGFTYWTSKSKNIVSIFEMTLFDQDNNEHFAYCSWKDTIKFESTKDNLNVRYGDSYVKGAFPNYEMYLKDLKNNIELDLKFHAKSMPHWVAQDVTDGWLPMGLGFYKYGFIPKCDLFGTMKIDDITFGIEGVGYFEHVWGNFSYRNPISNIVELKKTISTYSKLIGWWIHSHKIQIPKSIMFSTENNILGYDWVWALLDNGWSLFYGNILFWIMGGPSTGSLILSKDGKTYIESCNVNFKYNKTRYANDFDLYYPSELELTARIGKEKLHLRFTMTNDSREQVERFYGGKYWLGIVICEAPGIVDGYYFDGEKKIKLNGICKMEPQRQISVLGHNSLKLDFLLPPEGAGMSFDLDSHFFRKKVFTKIQLAPRPKIKFSMNRIDATKIHRNKV